MKTLFALAILLLTSAWLPAQDAAKAIEFVKKGIVLHDKGDFKGAVALYKKALDADKDNLTALAELGITSFSLRNYEDVVTYSERAIEKHPGNEALMTVFVTYGSALDAMERSKASVEVYDEGIAMFPKAYMLHFNKGITLSNMEQPEKAMAAFQQSAMLNPRHPGSHNAIARTLLGEHKRIPALLAYFRFLILEQRTTRASENLAVVQELISQGIAQDGKKGNVTISLDSEAIRDTLPNGDLNPNSFASAEMLLTMMGALDFDKNLKPKSEREGFLRKVETICNSLETDIDKGSGFTWEYYAPYFVEMKKEGLLETFSYIAFIPSNDAAVNKWIKSNEEKIDAFYKWSAEFDWKE
jgi:tetratricopeptide (TPR) repeat protein